jgi:serine/threonine-protein kinase
VAPSSNPLADKSAPSSDSPADPVAATGNAGPRDPAIGSGGRPGSQEDDRRVGTTLEGRYFLRRLCGEGAMGRVYEAHHVEIGRRVAIKILHPTFRHTPDVVERFRREARAASKIGHPNIVDVTDSGTTTDGAFFFVMEYLDGVNLEQVIARDGSLGLERALLIAAQVCRALAGAHAAGIVHRDLKPANVMLVRNRDEEDFVKVLDFGISKQSDLDLAQGAKDVGLTQPDVAVGTPIYMAPEQIAGHPADARTDVYAVGELLYEMLTGKSAFAGKDVMVVFNKKANVDPAPVRMIRPDAPEQLEAMLTRAMARRPDDRFPTMGALKDEIMRCLAHIEQAPVMAPIPITGTPTVVRPDRRTWRERRNGLPRSLRTYWIMGAGVVAGIIAALLLVVGKDESARDKPVVAEPNHVSAPTTAVAEHAPPIPTTAIKVAAPSPEAEPPAARDSEPAAKPTPSPQRPAVSASTRPPSPPTAQGSRPRSSKAALANVPGPTTAAAAAAASDTLVASGRAAFAKGDFAQAVRFGRQAVTVGDSLGSRLLLGDAFFKMNRYADALHEYAAAAHLAPTNPQALRGQELARQRLGKE